MTMRKIACIISLLLFTMHGSACTLFWASLRDRIFCAKNMDWWNTDARMLVIPPGEGKLGRIYFGIESMYGFTNTSGMNEAGLWYGGASLAPRSDIHNTYNKPRWDYELIEKVMEECSNVEEALEIFSTYWEPHWDGHTLLADKQGHCAVIYYGEDDVEYLRQQDDCQVITNFYLSDTLNSRWYHCHRYETANAILDSCEAISFSLFRHIADRTHAGGNSHPTVLTTIHDLHTGDMNICYMHNFEEYVTINLFDELAKGPQYVRCSDLFCNLRLCSPATGSVIDTESVTLEWKGDAKYYLVQYSRDPYFQTYTEISYTADDSENSTGGAAGWMVIMVLPFIISLKKRFPFCFYFLAIGLIFSCEDQNFPQDYSDTLHKIVIEVPEHAKYYWKVVHPGFDSRSETTIWSFKTSSF